jgi:recombination protein RecA
VNHGIIKKSGAWFIYGEDRFQGREGFRNQLKENETMLNSLEKEVRTKLGMIEEEIPEEKEAAETKKKK